MKTAIISRIGYFYFRRLNSNTCNLAETKDIARLKHQGGKVNNSDLLPELESSP